MKGGKGGRKRKDTSGGAAREGGPRGKPKKGPAPKRPVDAPPKKGSRKNPNFGGMPASGDE